MQTLEAIKVGPISGRGKGRKLNRRIHLTYEPRANKQEVYTESVVQLLADQLAFIADPAHQRRVTVTNGRDAVADACRAVELAGS